MATPKVFYDNLLLSGSVSGSAEATDNPVRRVHDGSINIAYSLTAVVSGGGATSGQVTADLGADSLAPIALVLPKCSLPSGVTVNLYSMDDPDGSGQATIFTSGIETLTTFLKAEISGATAKPVWRLEVSGATELISTAFEIQLALTKYVPLRPMQVPVTRTRVRQFTRTPIPGGQPFVKRDGPTLRRNEYTFILEGTKDAELVTLINYLEGGEAFTLEDDQSECYWAELLGNEQQDLDEAGVSTWRLAFQEIKVDG